MAEIETDKATMEFEATDEGVIEKIMVSEGTEGVAVNTPIAVLRGEDEKPGAAPAAKAAAPAAAAAPATAEPAAKPAAPAARSEEHTSELQSLMRISYAVFCLKKKN